MPIEQTERHDATFIVRIWWERGSSEGQTEPHWRGLVQHVRNGNHIYFTSITDLIQFIEHETGAQSKTGETTPGLL